MFEQDMMRVKNQKIRELERRLEESAEQIRQVRDE